MNDPLLQEFLQIVREETYDKEFNKVVDHYIETGRLSPVMYSTCTPTQKIIIQTIKRSFKRLTKKINENDQFEG